MYENFPLRDRVQISRENKHKLVDKKGRYDITRLMLFHDIGERYAYKLRHALEECEGSP